MRTPEQHLSAVLASGTAISPLEVGLLGAVGCVLARDVTAVDEDGSTHVLLTRGTAIAPQHVALLAAAGMGRVLVHPKPRVVVLTVGSGLVEPGTEGDDLYPDINGFALTAAATAAGAMAFRVGPLPSDADAVRTAIEDQLVRADMIVTACGMQAADYDLLTGVIRELGEVELVRVGMQPGGAQGFGRVGPDSTPLFVLPGNPVGALLGFDLFVRPLIRQMMGQLRLHHPMIQAQLETPLEQSATEVRYVRGVLAEKAGIVSVRSVEDDDSMPLGGLGTATAVIVVPTGEGRLKAGEAVQVIRLDA